MDYTKITLTTKTGINCSLGNLIYTFNNNKSVFDIYEAVEDADNENELINYLTDICDLVNKFTVRRITDSYIRLNVFDGIGNVRYLTIYK